MKAGRRPSCRWCRPTNCPPRDAQGRTVWVTRARPKIDRIACPWLIRRFVDPDAVFLFVAPSEVVAVGERFNATPFDIENVFWSHRGELCTFDVMVEEFGLATPPLLRLATMVRGADTGRLDLSPEAPGLLAASLGLSRMYRRRSRSSSRPACRCTTPSIAGAATPPARPTTGRPTSMGWAMFKVDAGVCTAAASCGSADAASRLLQSTAWSPDVGIQRYCHGRGYGRGQALELWCAPDGVHCALIRKAPTASVEPLKGKAHCGLLAGKEGARGRRSGVIRNWRRVE